MRRNRTTGSGGFGSPDAPRRAKRSRQMHVVKTLRALVELARSRRRLAHVPTRMQVSALAYFDGRQPRSYLLDPAVNEVPEPALFGEKALGRHALSFTGRYPDTGRRSELVALRDGGAFDRLGMSG